MKFTQYPKYKDSGLQWIGNIPESWTTNKIKYTSYVKGRIGWQGLKSDEFVDEGPYLVTGTDFKNEKVDWECCYHITEERYKEDPWIHVKENDLLITKDGTIGKVAYISRMPREASLNSHLLIIRVLDNAYYPRYLFWCFLSSVFTNYVEVKKEGTTFYGISQEEIEKFVFPLPSIREQIIISTFLDEKTRKFDSFINKNKQLIDLLKEKRAALVNRVVTRGLDPEVELKDSGTDLIGPIPARWELKRLKFLVNKIGSGITPKGGSLVYQEQGIPLIRSQNVHFDGLRLSDVVYISEDIYQTMISTATKKHDVLLNITGASIGRCTIIEDEFARGNVNQHVCIIRADPQKIFYKYLNYFLMSNLGQDQILSVEMGTSRQGFNFEQAGDIKIPLPTIPEQIQIAGFIEAKTREIDDTIGKIQRRIELLGEYKKSLINSVVTGKIDVTECN